MQNIKYADYEVGAVVPELSFGPIHHMDLVRYAGASGDFNPIHTDPSFAQQVGLKSTIAHGMYVMAQLGRLVTNWANPRQVRNLAVKFRDMTLPGQVVRCTGTVKKKVEEGRVLVISIEAVGDDGKVKVAGDLEIACD